MKNVLLINDSRFEALVMRDALIGLGFTVDIADENNAVSKADKKSFDIVISNYVMKNIYGDQLIIMIKMNHPGILGLLSSNNEIDHMSLKSKGIDAFFKTPIDEKALRAVINQAETGRQTPKTNSNTASGKALPRNLEESSFEEAMALLKMKTMTRPEKIKTQVIEAPNEKTQGSSALKFKFCPSCGSKLEEEGAQYRFCPFCGVKFIA